MRHNPMLKEVNQSGMRDMGTTCLISGMSAISIAEPRGGSNYLNWPGYLIAMCFIRI